MPVMRLYWPKEEALNGKWTPPLSRDIEFRFSTFSAVTEAV